MRRPRGGCWEREALSDWAATKAREIASDYLERRINPIEAALALMPLLDDLTAVPDTILSTFIAISSETDAIPLGERRTLWHPDVRAVEDAKHDRAQEWARGLMNDACPALVAELSKQ